MTDQKLRKTSGIRAKKPRTSVSFPQELYESLEQIAEEKKVSIAWVVRDAAEKYVADRWPLLERR